TGTFAANPENINDDNTTNEAEASGVGQYAEVDFGKVVVIKRWRQFGSVGNNGSGVWKIQYWNLATEAWVDWITGISTRTLATWSTLSEVTSKLTTKIRLVCTTVEGGGWTKVKELEVIY
ncbi:unnamed protein product, partial [marine sediment metagenome]